MDSALKQRLLGAVVLIALAVIFVPMFLGKSPQPQDVTTRNLAIPKPPQRSFQTQTLPVASPAAQNDPNKVVTVDTDKLPGSDTHPAANEPAAASAPAPATKPAPPAEKPVASNTPPPAVSKPAPAEPESSKDTDTSDKTAGIGTAGNFLVHLGAYADRGHADALVAKLKKQGFAAYDEPAEYHGKPVLRVRVGPYDTRGAAEAARLKIKRSEPRVPSSVIAATNAPPKKDAPASAVPAGKAGGWAVQLGAFSTKADANKLRDRLRNGGIASFVDFIKSDGKTLWRVRAGPYAARSDAENARATIKQKYRVNGIIVTQP